MNLESTKPIWRPRNRWLDEMREDGSVVGAEGWQEEVITGGMDEAPENGNKSSDSAHGNEMNKYNKDIV
jgi:hypothetical protein